MELAGVFALAFFAVIRHLAARREEEPPPRERLSRPDDPTLDLDAALHCGPLPSWAEERDGSEVC